MIKKLFSSSQPSCVNAVRCEILAAIAVAVFACASLQAQTLSPAWVELGENGQTIARIVVNAVSDCPALQADGKNLAMAPRLPVPDHFKAACQAIIPKGTKSASVNGQVLPLPKPDPKRVIAFGDTGCRIKDKRIQNCNDPNAWPFLQIASDSAQDHPDLIIHVGDFLYREDPCPESATEKCGGTPNGDTWAAWNADFFTPSAELLAAAPWVLARGNHESCDRSWRGWFYYLDPRDWTATCDPYSKPYVVKLGAFELALFDSSQAGEEVLDEKQAATYAAQLASLHVQNAWLVTHIPFWGFKAADTPGPPVALSASLEEAWNRASPPGIRMIVSGHIHLFEFVMYDSKRPPQLVAGTGGTQLAMQINPPAAGTAVRGAAVTASNSQQKFGYTLLEKNKDAWTLTLESRHTPLVTCRVLSPSSSCKTD